MTDPQQLTPNDRPTFKFKAQGVLGFIIAAFLILVTLSCICGIGIAIGRAI